MVVIHGTAVSTAETPEHLQQVDGVAWTDIVGLRRGWGSTFQGKPNQESWFHFSPLVPSVVHGIASGLSAVRIFFDCTGTALVDSVHLHDRTGTAVQVRDGLTSTTNLQLPFSAVPLANGIGISVHVSFGRSERSAVTFRGLELDLVPTATIFAPLVCMISGAATLRTDNPNAQGPFSGPVNARLTVDSSRMNVVLDMFAPIVQTFPTRLGPNTTTITLAQAASGTLDCNTGTLRILSPLSFSHSRDGIDNIQFALTTGSVTSPLGTLSGSQLDPAGNVRLVGTGRFSGGFLNGSNGDVAINAAISPQPCTTRGAPIMGSQYIIHGNAVTVAESPGGGTVFSGGDLLQVSGIAWSDVVGLRQGWGTTFRGKSGKFVWFHIPFPAPIVVNDVPATIGSIDLFVTPDAGVFVEKVHLWGNASNRWSQTEGLHASSNVTIPLPPGPLNGALGISIGVAFENDGNILFRGAALNLV